MSGSDWTGKRKTALRRMKSYSGWKRHTIEQLKQRLVNTLRRRIGRGYGLLQTPTFRAATTREGQE